MRFELARIRKDLEQLPDLGAAALMVGEAIEELENAEARAKLHGMGQPLLGPLSGFRRR